MKLTELEPILLKRINDKTHQTVGVLSDADGIMFLCPKCFAANKGRGGTHNIICWFNGRVLTPMNPLTKQWNPSGSNWKAFGFDPSGEQGIKVNGGCGWQGFIENGEVKSS